MWQHQDSNLGPLIRGTKIPNTMPMGQKGRMEWVRWQFGEIEGMSVCKICEWSLSILTLIVFEDLLQWSKTSFHNFEIFTKKEIWILSGKERNGWWILQCDKPRLLISLCTTSGNRTEKIATGDSKQRWVVFNLLSFPVQSVTECIIPPPGLKMLHFCALSCLHNLNPSTTQCLQTVEVFTVGWDYISQNFHLCRGQKIKTGIVKDKLQNSV